MPERQPVAEMRDAPDAETTLRLHARNVMRINARYSQIDEVLHRSVGADLELQELWQTSEEERLKGAAIVIEDVLRKGPLKPGVDRRRAVDVLWLLMAPSHLARLRSRGWSDSDYEAWLGDTLVAQLLP